MPTRPAPNRGSSRRRHVRWAGIGALAAAGLAVLSSSAFAAAPTAWRRVNTIAGGRTTPVGQNFALSGDGSTLVLAVGTHFEIFTRDGNRRVYRQTLPGNVGGLAVSENGSTIVVSHPDSGNNIGEVLIYARHGATWSHQATLSNPTDGGSGGFGSDTSVSGNGSTVLTSAGGTQAGPEFADFLYTRHGSSWTLAQKLPSPTGGAQDGFGGGVISGDGTTALLNWVGTNTTTTFATFVRSGSSWSEQGALISEPLAIDGVEYTGLADNGSTAVITNDTSGVSYQDLHTAQIVIYSRIGQSWTREQTITDPAPLTNEASLNPTTALSGNGRTILIGSRVRTAGRGTTAVYSLENGAWTQTATLAGPGPEAPVSEGSLYDQRAQVWLGVSADGSTAVTGVGAANNGHGAIATYRLFPVLTHAQWAWLHNRFIPTHYAPRRRGAVWSAFTSDPTVALSVIERFAPVGLR
jgi:hypothetical protein